MHLCKHVNTELVHSKAALCLPFTPIPWKRTRSRLLHGREITCEVPSPQPSGSELLKEGHSGLGALQRQLRRR